MDNILYHNNHSSLRTYPTNLTAGIVNPLSRVSYKQIVNINTRFRNNYTITPASDFQFSMPGTIKKVVAMRLLCINLPHTIYTVSNRTGSNNFTIDNTVIYIPNGSYTGSQMATAVTTALALAGFSISLNYDSITGKMTFNPTGGILHDFELDFNYIDPSGCEGQEVFSQVGSNLYKDQLTLGWLLGFRKNYKYRTPIEAKTEPRSILNMLQRTNIHSESASRREVRTLHNIRNRRPGLTPVKNNGNQYLESKYNCCDASGFMLYPSPLDISFSYFGENSYQGEAIYDAHGSRYFLLSVNDFQNNHTNTVISPLQQETLGDGCILGKITSSCCNGACIEHGERIYFGPTDISRLHIKLYDEFGRIVDLNNSDYSFTLELEILYDL